MEILRVVSAFALGIILYKVLDKYIVSPMLNVLKDIEREEKEEQ